ncbi:hypothetical protein MWH25_01280 [Natroniella acetigena]|nr:hypothetical protein [Natroniella acetigena]MCK8826379.1 hypothetical protein [Natroniella acetigena]
MEVDFEVLEKMASGFCNEKCGYIYKCDDCKLNQFFKELKNKQEDDENE